MKGWSESTRMPLKVGLPAEDWLLLECGTTRPALLAEVVVTWALFAVVVVVGAMAVVVFRCGESLPAKGRGVL